MIVETPLHVGSGTDLGIIDMPIQRERHTSFPKIEASGLKGAIRKSFKDLAKDETNEKYPNFKKDIDLAFGPETGDESAGSLGFIDAHVLLFPVKSAKGIFAWITCPEVLNTFNQILDLSYRIKNFPATPEERTCTENCQLLIKDDKIVLEEYTVIVKKDEKCTKLSKWFSDKILPNTDVYKYAKEKMKKDIVVLSDNDFKDFVNLSTEVITRTKIDDKKGVVQPGALFTEEYLPVETILYSLALTAPIFKKSDKDKYDFKKTDIKNEEDLVMEFFKENLPKVIQIGGNATIGKGIVRTRIWGDENE